MKNLSNKRFGRLTARWPVGYSPARKVLWFCSCVCGNSTISLVYALTGGRTGSCGCRRREVCRQRMTRHGLSRTAEYLVYKDMLGRCRRKPGQREFKNYGGRGISVCERWLGLHGFSNFLTDMGQKPSRVHSLDRVDVNGNYAPENCRWATAEMQVNNRTIKRIEKFSDAVLIAECKRRCLTIF